MTKQQQIAWRIPAYARQDFSQAALQVYLTGAKQAELCAWLSLYFYPTQAAAIAQLDPQAEDYETRARKILLSSSAEGQGVHAEAQDAKAEGEALFTQAQAAQGEEAKLLLTRAALRGHVGAQESLAWQWQHGKFGDVHLREAMRWYLAAAQEDGAAYGELGDILWEGKGVVVDRKQAVRFYERGGKQGDVYCCRQLGEAYLKGMGVEKSNERARYWYQQVLLQGDTDYKAEAEATLSCL